MNDLSSCSRANIQFVLLRGPIPCTFLMWIVKLPAHRAGLPGHAVASRMQANEISFFLVPLDPLGLSSHWVSQPIGPLNPAYKTVLVGHLPVNVTNDLIESKLITFTSVVIQFFCVSGDCWPFHKVGASHCLYLYRFTECL